MERDFMNFQIFKDEPYTEREAWIYLIENAAYKTIIREVDGMAITVHRGQLVGSYRYLAEAWQWKTPKGKPAKDRVRRYIEKLVRHKWLAIDTNYHVERDSKETASQKSYNKRPALITVMHYNALQSKETDNKASQSDARTNENATALRQQNDKPNQNQSKANNKQKNQLDGGSTKQNRFLFEQFPQVKSSEDFIKYMPQYWQNYALHEKHWDIETVDSEAVMFWERYAGTDLSDRASKISMLEKRKNWKTVWIKWCDQEFRNAYNDK